MPVIGLRVMHFYCNVSAKYLFYISDGWVFCCGWLDFVDLRIFSVLDQVSFL